MSVALISKVFKIKVGNSTRKLILIKLADAAGDDGSCYPSYGYLAAVCELSKRSVMQHVAALEEMGYLKRIHRKTPTGDANRSNVYVITLDNAELLKMPEKTPLTDAERIELVNQREAREEITPPAPKDTEYPKEFEFLWSEYPSRDGGNPKHKAYLACKARLKQGHTWREMVKGVRRYTAYMESRNEIGTSFVSMASTFFGTGLSFTEKWNINHANNSASGKQIISGTEHLSKAQQRTALARSQRDANRSRAEMRSPLGLDERTIQ